MSAEENLSWPNLVKELFQTYCTCDPLISPECEPERLLRDVVNSTKCVCGVKDELSRKELVPMNSKATSLMWNCLLVRQIAKEEGKIPKVKSDKPLGETKSKNLE